MSDKMDYFELLGLPRSFRIDGKALEEGYRYVADKFKGDPQELADLKAVQRTFTEYRDTLAAYEAKRAGAGHDKQAAAWSVMAVQTRAQAIYFVDEDVLGQMAQQWLEEQDRQ